MMVFVEQDWLKERLGNEDLVVVDCRFKLGDPDYGFQQFKKSHIPGAIFMDLEKDLSGEVKEHGGRHPLPDMIEFNEILEAKGITNDSLIVAYDAGMEPFASRFYWMMKYVGHEKVYILNGGFSEWVKAGYPVEMDMKVREKSRYELNISRDILASYEEVKKASEENSSHVVLIDSRDEKRYKGLEEPIDKKAGHIPGAINEVWTNGFKDGRALVGEEQRKRFSQLNPESQIIVYCGSGVTAAPNYVALKEAGFEHVKVYIGSFSDWVSYDDNPVATCEE
jgi:thiosulfate/3-mercaptopyruvate sulfurtransferase